MSKQASHFYEFGPFRIDVAERLLLREGEAVPLTPKAFETLLLLVESAGHAVEKEELMKRLWPDTFVEEANLANNISLLRKALEENPNGHEYIKTVPRRGYRFVGVVKTDVADDMAASTDRAGLGAAGVEKQASGTFQGHLAEAEGIIHAADSSVETISPTGKEGGPSDRSDTNQDVQPAIERLVRTARVSRYWMWTALGLAAVGIVVAVVLAVYYRGRPGLRPRVVRATIPAPENAQSGFGNVVVSPDGLQFVFSMDWHGKRSLWLRPIGEFSAQPLAGTEGANSPFWSPDSRFIGFFADNKVKKIEVSSGAIQTLCQAGTWGRGGTWSRDGVIVFALDGYGPLYRVSDSGGDPVAVRPDNWRKEQTYYRNPCFLPDGRHVIYRAGVMAAYVSSSDRNGIYACSLESNESKRILGADTYAVYASGHLLFWAHGALMAQPFDEKNLRLTGDAVQLAAGVYFDPRNFEAEFSVTENGVLVFVSGAPTLGQLVWFDRSGKEVGKLGEPGLVTSPRISPDGKQVAAEIVDPQGDSDIWVYDLVRNGKTRLTFDASRDTTPVWSPDGRQIAFSSNQKDIRRFDICKKDLGGSGSGKVHFESDKNNTPQSWSSDGQFIAFARNLLAPSLTQIWVLPLTGEREPFPFLQSREFSYRWPQFSPDGRFIAYVSYESGRGQVCVTSFPGPGFKQQVSTDGGWLPCWRRDGKELFFLAGGISSRDRAALAGKMMAADVKTNGSILEIGNARPLFEAHPWLGANPPSMPQQGFWQGTVYDATPDGKRFLMVVASEATPATINLVVNWTADLKR
jgi:DNA-binding winged helix-turn-helix (wHTH) protein/Tol biopolymer transport system component